MDEELVNCYLKRKINGQEIKLAIIPEVDLYKCEPWMMGPRRTRVHYVRCSRRTEYAQSRKQNNNYKF
ncbi:hypothetical protein F2Q70_00010104 [Brassica cretica]|uniref:NAC domain-containing protein n=1 Tax=Brassica cretica TaxID=69181 RepID=A0A8S9M9X1_BRACR|nr:hypothetical protein F2Q70_00010104 [Brassica cretica]